VKGRVVKLRTTIIGIVSGFFGLVLTGCAGLALPQQPRLEIAKAAGSVMVSPHGPFFSPQHVTLARAADGTLRVHSPSAEKWAHQNAAPDDAVLDHLHGALLPFLVPACESIR
jgi:hypothetical protein